MDRLLAPLEEYYEVSDKYTSSMTNRIDLSIILACYNEQAIFSESLRRIIDVLDLSRLSYEIILVDDKSQDQTAKLIRKFARTKLQNPIKTIFHQQNQGRGRSVTDGILNAKGTVVGYIDIDLEVSPVYIPLIVKRILAGKSDMILGRRVYRTTITSLVREFLSVGYRLISKSLIDTGDLDTESGYKFFRLSKILPVLKQVKNNGWFWDTEIVVLSRYAGLKVTETPVLFLRRFDKQSSVNIWRDTFAYIIHLWQFKRRLDKSANLH
jgi:glycosyltransferase involved in cell wall biosynthesis